MRDLLLPDRPGVDWKERSRTRPLTPGLAGVLAGDCSAAFCWQFCELCERAAGLEVSGAGSLCHGRLPYLAMQPSLQTWH